MLSIKAKYIRCYYFIKINMFGKIERKEARKQGREKAIFRILGICTYLYENGQKCKRIDQRP